MILKSMLNFSERLRAEIEFKGMLQKELAAKAGIKKRALDMYLGSQGSMPPADVAVKIAKALDVSVEYLVTGENFSFEQTLQKSAMSLAMEASNLDESEIELLRQLVKKLRKQK